MIAAADLSVGLLFVIQRYAKINLNKSGHLLSEKTENKYSRGHMWFKALLCHNQRSSQ